MAKASVDTLIDAHVSTRQCKLAIDALCAHALKKEQEQQETELLPRKEQHVWLVVAVKQIHPEKKLMPFKIPIVHPLVDPRTTPICLITKDPQREYKDLLESNKIKFISRVVGLEKLKGKFKPFEARRILLKENGLFLADARVIPMLPKLLGNRWFEAKKQPIPVSLTRKDLKSELERAISSTYMHQNRGTCTSIKISTLSQSPVHILANLTSALPAIASHIKGGWSNIQSLHIKTNSSVSLPIWNCSLGDDNEGGEGRWARMEVDEENVDSDEEDVNSDEEDADSDEEAVNGDGEASSSAAEEPPKEKGKKRSLDDDTEKPKKKAKSAKSTDAFDMTSESPLPAVLGGKKPKKAKGVEPAPVVSAPLPGGESESGKKTKKIKSTGTADVTGHPPSLAAPSGEKNTGKKPKKAKGTETTSVVNVTADSPVPAVLGGKKPKIKAAESKGVLNMADDSPAAVLGGKKEAGKKHKKVEGTEATPVVNVPSNSPLPAVLGGKKAKVKVAGPNDAPNVTGDSPVPPVLGREKESGKKPKKAKATESPAVVSVSGDSPRPAVLRGEKQSGKQSKKVKGAESTDVSNTAGNSSILSVPGGGEESGKKPKAKKSAAGVDEPELSADKSAGASAAVPVRKEELKQKRSANSVEKKKGRVSGGKGLRSAKDAVIGKKVARG